MMTNDKKDHNCTNKGSGQEVEDPPLQKGRINISLFLFSTNFKVYN